MNYKYLIYTTALLSINVSSANAQTDIPQNIQQGIGNFETVMAKKVSMADALIVEATQSTKNNDFLLASRQYLQALNLLEESKSNSPFVKSKLESVLGLLDQVYNFYAEEQIKKAKFLAKKNDLPQAEQLCTEIKLITKNKKLLKEVSELEVTIAHNARASIETLEDNYKNELYEIDILNRRGKALFKNAQYTRALEAFEGVIVKDPYNVVAISSIRKIYNITAEIGALRTQATRNERIAETIWKTVSPLKTVSSYDANEGDSTLKVDETFTIKEKLETIKFPHIEYDELSITAVVKDLKRRSKQLDLIDHTGVNMFLRLASDIVAPSSKDDQENDDLGDDDFDDDDFGDDDFGSDDEESIDNVPTVSMVVEDISLIDVIKFVCQTANLKYRIEKYAVVIADKSVPFEELETRIYPVSQDAELDDDVKTYFEDLGVDFNIVGSNIVLDININRLIATNTPENLSKVESIMSELNVGNPMVVIEAKFVEVAQNDFEQLTVNPNLTINKSGGEHVRTVSPDFSIAGSNSHDDLLLTDRQRDVTTGVSKWEWDNNDGKGGSDLDLLVKAVERMESANFLSTPRVVTLSGQEAEIKVVDEIYYPENYSEAQSTNGSRSIKDDVITIKPGSLISPFPEFGEATEEGIIFTVTPEVDLETGVITLQMNPTFTKKIGEDNYPDIGTYFSGNTGGNLGINYDRKFPIMRKREVSTTVSIFDGGTIILGGAIEDDYEELEDKTPFLSDLPIIGSMFTHKYKRSLKKNLLIFVTARLINPDGSLFNEPIAQGLPRQRR